MIKKLLLTAGVLFVFYVAYTTFVSPRIEHIDEEVQRYESASEVVALRVTAASTADLPQARTELAEISTQLPATADQRAIISELVAVFDAAGVTWIQGAVDTQGEESLIQFSASDAKAGGLLGVNLDFTIEGSVDAVRNALTGMNELERWYTVTTVQLSYKAATRTDETAAPDQVSVAIGATAWVWKPSPPLPLPDPEPAVVEDEEAE